MATGVVHFEFLLERARRGDQGALGQLLQQYRQPLGQLAYSKLGQSLRARLDPSDLIQETLLEAQRDFRQFVGCREGELVAWLRRILVRNLADHLKHHQSQKRDLRREERLDILAEKLPSVLAASNSTPSAQVSRREQTAVMINALAQLPADYREVLTLRHLEGRRFEAIGIKMGRTTGATRMLWMRALERLGGLIESS